MERSLMQQASCLSRLTKSHDFVLSLLISRAIYPYRWILHHAASCGLLLVKEECRISSLCWRLLVLAKVR